MLRETPPVRWRVAAPPRVRGEAGSTRRSVVVVCGLVLFLVGCAPRRPPPTGVGAGARLEVALHVRPDGAVDASVGERWRAVPRGLPPDLAAAHPEDDPVWRLRGRIPPPAGTARREGDRQDTRTRLTRCRRLASGALLVDLTVPRRDTGDDLLRVECVAGGVVLDVAIEVQQGVVGAP